MPGINNILHQQHMLVEDIQVQVKGDAHLPGGLPAANAIRRDGHKLDRVGDRDVPHQVSEEKDTAAQDAN